ncbi:MAG: hypothetical protein FWD09_00560 [Lentimicrobiaceae bacterium]|nr:hypothetical protein [Lentimicrobiaceae bacterium]
MKKCYFLIFLSIIVFLNFSCVRPNLTPAYLFLHIEDFQDCIDVSNLHDRGYSQDELDIIKHQNFKDALVSLNGQQTGFWNLEWPDQRPCTIPLLPDYEKTNYILIVPCARIVSMTLTTVPYHFLISMPEEHLFDMEERGEYKLSNLKFQYRPAVDFPVRETFVQSTRFESIDTAHGAPLNILPVEVEGVQKSVGKVDLNSSLPYFNIATEYFSLPGQGVRQFWEIYYQSDHGEMTTYLNFRNSPMGIFDKDMAVFPSSGGVWKKAYIELTDEISDAAGYLTNISVRLGIRGNLNKNAPNAYFHLGHIKVITMPSY